MRYVALHDFVLKLLLVFELAPTSTASRAKLTTALENADPCASGAGGGFDDP
jgi:hypothetical protein